MFIEDVSGKPNYEIEATVLLLRSFGYNAKSITTKRMVKKGCHVVQEELIVY